MVLRFKSDEERNVMRIRVGRPTTSFSAGKSLSPRLMKDFKGYTSDTPTSAMMPNDARSRRDFAVTASFRPASI